MRGWRRHFLHAPQFWTPCCHHDTHSILEAHFHVKPLAFFTLTEYCLLKPTFSLLVLLLFFLHAALASATFLLLPLQQHTSLYRHISFNASHHSSAGAMMQPIGLRCSSMTCINTVHSVSLMDTSCHPACVVCLCTHVLAAQRRNLSERMHYRLQLPCGCAVLCTEDAPAPLGH